jgi:uncharacterized membrane protein
MRLEPEAILLVAVAIPMILNMVPRNRFYGFRTPRTLASDEVWYPANRFAGKALTIAGLGWAALPLVVPREYVTPVGVVFLVLAVVASFHYLRTL